MRETLSAKLMRLGSQSLVYGLSAIVGRFLSFLLQPFYAHEFIPAQNGVQGIVYSYIPLISIAFYCGMDVAYMRSVAGLPDQSTAERERAFTAPMSVVALFGGAVFVVALLLAPQLGPMLRLSTASFRYMIAIVYTDALLALPYAHLRMINKATRYAALRLLFVGLSVGLNVWLIGFLHWGINAIFLSNIAANLAVLGLMIGEVRRNFVPARLRGAEWRALLRYALPVLPAILAVMLIENGDRIVLNFLPTETAWRVYRLSTMDVVGIYSFNYKLGVVMLLVVQMFRLAWTPFAFQHAKDPMAPQLFSRALTALVLICGLVFLLVALWLPIVAHIPEIYRYVKPGYWVGLPIVPIILLGYAFSGIYSVVTAGLYIERRTGELALIAGAGALLNLIVCILAARGWGLTGVAWATPGAYALMTVLGAWRSQKVFAVPFEWGRVALVAGLVACIAALDSWIAPSLAPSALPVVKGMLVASFPAVLIITRFFREGEIKAMRAVVLGSRPWLTQRNVDEPI